MRKKGKADVVLLPNTLDHYQERVTRMLETERYGEAMETLEFLLGCEGQDERRRQEWNTLLEWLRVAFPGGARDAYGNEAVLAGEEPEDEAQALRRRTMEKQREDAGYERELLSRAIGEPLTERGQIALEQLAYLENPETDLEIIRWLESAELHPLLQFRVLQTLRRRGASGTVRLPRGGATLELEIERTPSSPDDFPPAAADVLERVAAQTDNGDPSTFYFARELWIQFLMSAYGTSDYDSLVRGEENELDAWAAALHAHASETLEGGGRAEEIREAYGITGELRFRFERAERSLRAFSRRSGGR
ncbi:hypothetical protein [Saccharibacillus alkalitolerans]|uniref:Uncharacterized protein n=1 Tax=Saccharibacillus alkalitolerans TaxID=2705290 RepID=A0ABX0F996_9BACL|nr:hypothetical protein [Saccharibacillus alkalitolerans]NGZ77542.1 hypothetical protein [Saccharibacillus alkalitolerans]